MDNKTKWTQGPWGCSVSAFMSDRSDTRTYFIVNGTGLAGREKANAQLIASAPELYEALRVSVEALEKTANDSLIGRNAAEDGRIILAKARGEQP